MGLEEVVVTDTLIPKNQENLLKCPKLKTVSVGLLLAEAIRRIHQKESLSVLFKHQNYVSSEASTERTRTEERLRCAKKNQELNEELKKMTDDAEGAAKRAR